MGGQIFQILWFDGENQIETIVEWLKINFILFFIIPEVLISYGALGQTRDYVVPLPDPGPLVNNGVGQGRAANRIIVYLWPTQ